MILGIAITNGMVVVPVVAYFVTDAVVSLVQWRRRAVDERHRHVVPEPRRNWRTGPPVRPRR